MDENSKQKTLGNLTKAETILVTVSTNAGFDGMAAGLALYLSLIKLGKNARIFATKPTVSDAQALYGVDKIGQSQGSQDLVIVVKNAVENVDKVTHSLEGDDLKLVVKTFPGATSVSRDQISFETAQAAPNMVFAIGYLTADQLRQEITHEQNLDPNLWLVNINRQDVGELFAQVNAFSPQAASICEVTAQIFQQLALPLDEDISYNLYAGIANATNYFSPSQAVPLSFETAAWLLKFGAGHASFAQPTLKPQTASLNLPFAPSAPIFRQQFSQAPAAQPVEDFDNSDKVEFPQPDPYDQPPIEQVERKGPAQESWLKPPKVYKGSKSFDSEK